jgi:hypothetical protein
MVPCREVVVPTGVVAAPLVAFMNPNPAVVAPVAEFRVWAAKALFDVGLGASARLKMLVNSIRMFNWARSLMRKMRPSPRFSFGRR